MRVPSVDWSLDVRYREKTFSGTATIALEAALDPLVVDASQLTIDSATVDGRAATFHEDREKGTLEFAGLSPEPHQLRISYHGVAAADSLVGMYVSPSGPEYCLTTMLFPTGARRLLPSFEHPTVKTIYRLTLTIDPKVLAIFNTSPTSERMAGGRRELTFEPTPPMSAYLLYLGVGAFDTIQVRGQRWSVTVAASPGRAPSGRHSAEQSLRMLDAYEQYYARPYPLSKLDLVALENFWAGAMENWGAIAFREELVLVDPSTSVRARRQVLLTLAHEIAHQWFGNLVTAAWWDDFWLNESFATFVGHRIVSRLYPEADAWSTFVVTQTSGALELDSMSSTHPIQVPVNSAEDLGEISDQITYGKGASVLRMIESYLGEEAFRKGVSEYLARFQYSNARGEDLWAALAEVSDRPVARVMSAWIRSPGFPVLHASWREGKLLLRQERYRADGTPMSGNWPIPLHVASPSGESTTLFEESALTLPLDSPVGLRIDPGRTVFARLHYDDSLFDQMVSEFPAMSPVDQWGFVSDTHSFVYAGLLPLDRLLQVVRAGTPLTHELPVRTIATILSGLYRPLHDVPGFLEASRAFLRAQLARVGLESQPGEPDSLGFLREELATSLVDQDTEFARSLAPRFAEFDHLPAELREAVAISYSIVEGRAALAPLVARLRSTAREAERVEVLRALGAFREPELIREVLGLVPSPGLTPSGTLSLLAYIIANPTGRGELFAWYRTHSKLLSEMWGGTPLLSLFLRGGMEGLGMDREEEVRGYFADHTPPGAAAAVAQGLEALHLTMRLRIRSR